MKLGSSGTPYRNRGAVSARTGGGQHRPGGDRAGSPLRLHLAGLPRAMLREPTGRYWSRVSAADLGVSGGLAGRGSGSGGLRLGDLVTARAVGLDLVEQQVGDHADRQGDDP